MYRFFCCCSGIEQPDHGSGASQPGKRQQASGTGVTAPIEGVTQAPPAEDKKAWEALVDATPEATKKITASYTPTSSLPASPRGSVVSEPEPEPQSTTVLNN
jgi:hypothetical protein